MVAVKCFPLNTSGRGLESINDDDSMWFSTLYIIFLTLIAYTGGAMARSSTRSINVNTIRRQLRVVMIFSLPISDNIKDRLKFSYLEEAILDKGLLSESEFNKSTMNATIMDAYGGNEIDLILDMIDEDALVYIT